MSDKERVEAELKNLIGGDLIDFRIKEVTEVYRVNVDGFKTISVGFFYNEDVAKAFAGNQTDANYHKTEKRLVLTDGKVAFVIDTREKVEFIGDEEAALAIKKKALEKLTLEEKKLLGLDV